MHLDNPSTIKKKQQKVNFFEFNVFLPLDWPSYQTMLFLRVFARNETQSATSKIEPRSPIPFYFGDKSATDPQIWTPQNGRFCNPSFGIKWFYWRKTLTTVIKNWSGLVVWCAKTITATLPVKKSLAEKKGGKTNTNVYRMWHMTYFFVNLSLWL